jgi:ubiquinone/menaquinone biosynthesis C-methylase UbiE
MDHQIRDEFAHQAKQMVSAPAFHAEPVLQWLASTVIAAPAARVLDLACGPGIVAETIASCAGEVIGIDATVEMLRLARDRLDRAAIKNGRFSAASAERLPFLDRSFDQVISRLTLHHFPSVPAVLAEIRRVLLRDGQLLVADVISSEDPQQSTLHNSLEQLRDPTHVRMFPRADLLRIVTEAGFEISQEGVWQQPRAFREWAAIIANPARTVPLEHIMRVLARAGQDAGIALREESGELHFTHTWLLLAAKRV